jgi:hypothetical protein
MQSLGVGRRRGGIRLRVDGSAGRVVHDPALLHSVMLWTTRPVGYSLASTLPNLTLIINTWQSIAQP